MNLFQVARFLFETHEVENARCICVCVGQNEKQISYVQMIRKNARGILIFACCARCDVHVTRARFA